MSEARPQPLVIRWIGVTVFLLGVTVAVQTPEPVPAVPASPVVRRVARPVYRYSVVPGGIYNGAEAAAAAARDHVVAIHYQGFDFRRARPLRMSRDLLAHVSYRRGDNVYWTSQQVRVPGGEILLSDGIEILRARCGNRLSERPRMPTGSPEPTPSELESSIPSPGSDREMLVAARTEPLPPPDPRLAPVASVVSEQTGTTHVPLAAPGSHTGLGPVPPKQSSAAEPPHGENGGWTGGASDPAAPWLGPFSASIWPIPGNPLPAVSNVATGGAAVPPPASYFPLRSAIVAVPDGQQSDWQSPASNSSHPAVLREIRAEDDVPPLWPIASAFPPLPSDLPPTQPWSPPETPSTVTIPEASTQPVLLLLIAGLFWHLRTDNRSR